MRSAIALFAALLLAVPAQAAPKAKKSKPRPAAELTWLSNPRGWGVTALAFSADGKLLLTADGEPSVKLWDAVTGALVRTLPTPRGVVTAAAFSSDGKWLAMARQTWVREELIARSDRKTISIWDTSSWSVAREHERPATPDRERHERWGVEQLRFLPDGALLADGDRLDVVAGTWQTEWLPWLQRVSPDGRRALAMVDKELKLLELPSRAVLAKVESPDWSQAAFSADGREVIVSQAPATPVDPEELARRQKGHYISNQSGGPAELAAYDAASGKRLRGVIVWEMFLHRGGGVQDMSTDGRLLATAGEFDRILRVWSAATGQMVARTQAFDHSGEGRIAFSPAGDRVAAATPGGEVKVLPVPGP